MYLTRLINELHLPNKLGTLSHDAKHSARNELRRYIYCQCLPEISTRATTFLRPLRGRKSIVDFILEINPMTLFENDKATQLPENLDREELAKRDELWLVNTLRECYQTQAIRPTETDPDSDDDGQSVTHLALDREGKRSLFTLILGATDNLRDTITEVEAAFKGVDVASLKNGVALLEIRKLLDRLDKTCALYTFSRIGVLRCGTFYTVPRYLTT